MLAALTLLPATLRLAGRSGRSASGPVDGALSRGGGRFWHQDDGGRHRPPVLSVVLAGGILLAAAVPYLTLDTGQNFIESLARGQQRATRLRVLNEEFDTGCSPPRS